ncbi:MAG: metallophosphoesterase [Proteobacteria bacterium]|nr:MAG: metallophosphoesterase [Pseudomonadota bacterium]
MRVAAVGDVHFDRNSHGRLRDHLDQVASQADVLLLAGDLTQTGHIEEVRVLAEDLRGARIPIVAVLGNHDYHADQVEEMTNLLESVGVAVLNGTAVKIKVGNCEVGIAGIKGFGGGFPGATASEFGEPEMKDFIRTTKRQAAMLREALLSLDTPYKIALLHYSPIADTLMGEKKEIFPFLGSYLLAEAIDNANVDVAFHGHAHKGMEKGVTFGGVPVRNVAQPVIRHVCNIYTLNKHGIDREGDSVMGEGRGHGTHGVYSSH